ncbi:branched-chain amino acid transport system ATP-binding protein [Cryobacterium flavum]|uniref:ABC transporter ATP-binding protein n=1 Tax=Cryobacterium flavum TaxID=1424659 RepID=A0A4R8V5I8_9MICO|nr:ABC transporter ATP-binding protein [Cryobacterium flavum]TFB78019.1 ABC transporter ATP-binding protein [Cryobacterium flavum]SDO24015.1 branched-chain amino acid transport system ATP-binding protein [Cryobacterium flavum]
MTETNVTEVILELDHVSKTFGALQATDDVSTVVRRGERRALIGPNGAGKSTLVKLINGHLVPTSGTIRFLGNDITRVPSHERVRRGMAMTFQHSSLLDDMSVHDNLVLAVQRTLEHNGSWFTSMRKHRDVTQRVAEVIERLRLDSESLRLAGDLAHGQRRRVEIALAYATEPQLLLLDEPAAGMSPGEIEDFLEFLSGMDELTFILIEHNIDVVMRVASSISVLDAGRIIASGDPETVSKSEEVQLAYLGSSMGEDLFR